jgi:hypothetical protein
MKADVQEAIMDPGSPSLKILFPEWQPTYQVALLEPDPKKLFQRVAEAEAAVFNRLQTMSHNPESDAERQAIKDAMATLRVLKREKLGFPDWAKK